MWSIQGMAFVPGRAGGVVRRGLVAADANAVLVLTHHELSGLTGRPAGLIVVDGAPFSHRMLGLFRRSIPTVLLTRQQATGLAPGASVELDGALGMVAEPGGLPPPLAEPTPAGRSGAATADAETVYLHASVSDARGARLALERGAGAIGLVRSELLDVGGDAPPDAAAYEASLAALCQAAAGLAVTVRLPDFTLDKQPPWLAFPSQAGGLLGQQGCRLYGQPQVRSVLVAVLQAVGRLAVDHRLALLVPYLTFPEEFRHWRLRIEDILSVPVPLAPMVETPAAALEMAQWLELADRVAVGCNDLMQCLFAVDRDNPQLVQWLEPYAPALYRFLRLMARAAGEGRARIQLCGLLPQLPGVLPVLIGLGYRVFSVEPLMVAHLARCVSLLDVEGAQRLAEGVCAAPDAAGVRALLDLGGRA
ncbi:MAG: phosphoenolpyruvate-protein phosphotransferase [Gammaproteobacteria bacterium]